MDLSGSGRQKTQTTPKFKPPPNIECQLKRPKGSNQNPQTPPQINQQNLHLNMAYHHSHHLLHHHHPPPQPPPPPPSTTTHHQYSCCNTSSTSSFFLPPHHHATDPLVEAIVARLLETIQIQQQPINHFSLKPKPHFPNHQKDDNFHSVLSSLIDRIDALESSLRSFTLSPHHHHRVYGYGNEQRHGFSLIRDSAARVIQTHFRSFLVRRSRTLTHLKHLAYIKSNFVSLKNSVSLDTHFNLHRVSSKAMDLLLQLDSIQDSDPMIRDGKRSISRDLDRFLDHIDGIAVRRHELKCRATKSVRVMGVKGMSDKSKDQRDMVENLKARVERIRGLSRALESDEEGIELEGFSNFSDGEASNSVSRLGNAGRSKMKHWVPRLGHGVQPRIKKSVTFDEKGNEYRVIHDIEGRSSCGEDDSASCDDHCEEVLENLANEVDEIKGSSYGVEDDEEGRNEKDESEESSDGDLHRRRFRNEGILDACNDYHGHNSKFAFSAPKPDMMEPKADLMKRRKDVTVRIVT